MSEAKAASKSGSLAVGLELSLAELVEAPRRRSLVVVNSARRNSTRLSGSFGLSGSEVRTSLGSANSGLASFEAPQHQKNGLALALLSSRQNGSSGQISRVGASEGEEDGSGKGDEDEKNGEIGLPALVMVGNRSGSPKHSSNSPTRRSPSNITSQNGDLHESNSGSSESLFLLKAKDGETRSVRRLSRNSKELDLSQLRESVLHSSTSTTSPKNAVVPPPRQVTPPLPADFSQNLALTIVPVSPISGTNRLSGSRPRSASTVAANSNGEYIYCCG